MPAIFAARESARTVTCSSNLRQLGVGLADIAQRKGSYGTGAFDWSRDGAATEFGWVADLVNLSVPVGEMLCPSSPGKISETYNDLISTNVAASGTCKPNSSGSAHDHEP